MIVSGFLLLTENCNINQLKENLEKNGVEVHYIKDNRVVFLIEGNVKDIKKKLKWMKDLDGVINVYLAYYSLEDL